MPSSAASTRVGGSAVPPGSRPCWIAARSPCASRSRTPRPLPGRRSISRSAGNPCPPGLVSSSICRLDVDTYRSSLARSVATMRLSQCITRAAQVAPQRTATVFGERSRSWGELADRVARLASALKAVGVRSGDRVAFLGGNSDRRLEWFFAIGWAGAVVVPVSPRLAPPEVRHVLSDSGASVLFADDDSEEMIAAADPVAPAPGSGRELAALFYTGGTTGRAKAVMVSHDNLIANAFHVLP